MNATTRLVRVPEINIQRSMVMILSYLLCLLLFTNATSVPDMIEGEDQLKLGQFSDGGLSSASK